MTAALTQRTDEWLNFRKKGVGASDAPIIMGVSPWKTPFQLWQEKLDLRTPPTVNFIDKEEEARQFFQKEMGIEISQDIIIHRDVGWRFASLDGINRKHKILLEIKSSGEKDHNFVKTHRKAPEKYYPQLQHAIDVVGTQVEHIDKCYYLSYVNEHDNIILEIKRDDEYIKNLIKKEEDFFYCMKNFISPELTHKDYVLIDNPMWEETVKELIELSDSISKLENREKELKDILIAISEGCSCCGAGIKLCRSTRKGNIDYNRIEALKGIDLERYRKPPVECWKIMKDA